MLIHDISSGICRHSGDCNDILSILFIIKTFQMFNTEYFFFTGHDGTPVPLVLSDRRNMNSRWKQFKLTPLNTAVFIIP